MSLRPLNRSHTRPVLLLLTVIGLAACSGPDRVRILRLGHGLDVGHPVHRAMVHMADTLAVISGGRMRLDIYPGGQLGEERELIELLQIGTLAMTKVSASPLESFVPEMAVFSIPYVFRDLGHVWQTLDSPLGRELLQAGERFRLRGLGYYDAGPRSFYTRATPIRTPGDLAGLKIRVQKSITSRRMIQALGGSATPIDWGELYSALQQGVVDGAENNPPSFQTSRHYEVCRYYSLDEHTWVPDVLLISTRVWEALDSRERAWVESAAETSVTVQRQLWQRACSEALEVVEEAGVEIVRPDTGAFRTAVRSLHDSYYGTPIGDLIARIERIGSGDRGSGEAAGERNLR